MPRRAVFDIESDGLLDAVTQMWVGVILDLDTGEVEYFSDHFDAHPMNHLPEALEQYDEIIGHNIIDYDLPLLKRFCGWDIPDHVKPIDTLILSQMDYKRFGFGHSMDKWAERFGKKKVEIKVWTEWDPKLIRRCESDCRLNAEMYQALINEVKIKGKKFPAYRKSVAAEHATSLFVAEGKERGWRFDRKAALVLKARLEQDMEKVAAVVNPQLKLQVKVKKNNKGETVQKPNFNKDGRYNHHQAKWFGIDPERGRTDRPIAGPYTPIYYKRVDLGNIDSVKEYLFTLGWEPLDFNFKKVGRKLVKTSPKLCYESLSRLGQLGIDIDRFYTTRSRHSILKGWLKALDENDRLHGDAYVIGTPTFRMRHKIICNVPSGEVDDDGNAVSLWGPEVRSLFIADDDKVIVGGDSAGNQARALCHYINDPEFTDLTLHGDVHGRNADVLECARSAAKRWYYAFLFGAGGEKLGMYRTGVRDYEDGMKYKDIFLDANPKLKGLVERLEEVFEKTLKQSRGKRGYIPALDGRRVYSDSRHKLLNYLLQSFEAITCKAALLYFVQKMKEEGIQWWPLIFYHDEIQVEVYKKDAERTAEIMVEAFTEAPKWYGVTIMSGDAKIGRNWCETH